MEIPLTNKGTLALTTSFNYYKTAIYDGFNEYDRIKELIFNQHTLEIPASLKFTFSPGKRSNVFICRTSCSNSSGE